MRNASLGLTSSFRLFGGLGLGIGETSGFGSVARLALLRRPHYLHSVVGLAQDGSVASLGRRGGHQRVGVRPAYVIMGANPIRLDQGPEPTTSNINSGGRIPHGQFYPAASEILVAS